MSDQSHSIGVSHSALAIHDIALWQPTASPKNMESAIRELQNTLIYIIREMDRQGRQMATLESRLVELKKMHRTES